MKALREARRTADHSQEQVARFVGVSQPTVSYWERGVWTPAEENAEQLEEYVEFVREMTE